MCLRCSPSVHSYYLFENTGFSTLQNVRMSPNKKDQLCLTVKKYLPGQRVKINLNFRARKTITLIRLKTNVYFNLTII